MISEHLDTVSTEIFQNEKACKTTIHNPLSLSEEVTLHYLSLPGAWMYRGSCLHEEIIRNLIQVFVDHDGLVLHLFPSQHLVFWILVVTFLQQVYSQHLYYGNWDLWYCWTVESWITSRNWEIHFIKSNYLISKLGMLS